MTTDDKEIVSALRAVLADKVGTERFELWFGASTRLDFDGRTLTVGVPNRFFLEWIRASFRGHIESACMAVLGKCPAVKFHVDSTLPDPQAEPRPAPAGGTPKQAGATSRHAAGNGAAAAPAVQSHANGAPRRKFADLESFVAGASNRLALASAEMVVRQPGQMTPLRRSAQTLQLVLKIDGERV